MGMPTMVCSSVSLQERRCLVTPAGSNAVQEGRRLWEKKRRRRWADRGDKVKEERNQVQADKSKEGIYRSQQQIALPT